MHPSIEPQTNSATTHFDAEHATRTFLRGLRGPMLAPESSPKHSRTRPGQLPDAPRRTLSHPDSSEPGPSASGACGAEVPPPPRWRLWAHPRLSAPPHLYYCYTRIASKASFYIRPPRLTGSADTRWAAPTAADPPKTHLGVRRRSRFSTKKIFPWGLEPSEGGNLFGILTVHLTELAHGG